MLQNLSFEINKVDRIFDLEIEELVSESTNEKVIGITDKASIDTCFVTVNIFLMFLICFIFYLIVFLLFNEKSFVINFSTPIIICSSAISVH